jgi:hypothetical protein
LHFEVNFDLLKNNLEPMGKTMKNMLTWAQMKKKYPNQWLVITDFKFNKFGEVIKGVVEQHSKSMNGINKNPIIDRDTAIRYTGESTFAGLRSHAAHNHPF